MKSKNKPKNWVVHLTKKLHGNMNKELIFSTDESDNLIRKEAGREAELIGKEGYYHGKHAWELVSRDIAERLTHKEANRIRGKMKRLGYTASIEEVK